MKYKLFCVDLDGTLLTDQKEIDGQDIEALRKASGQGVKIALITGRMPAATDMIVRKLAIPCIRACNAGTYILKDERCIHAEYLSVETMTEIYERVKDFGIPLWIFRGRQWYVTSKDSFVYTEEGLIDHMAEETSVEALAKKWRREQTGPNKLLIGAEPSIVQNVYAVLRNRQDADMACSSENYLEIFPKGMNKGKALRVICEKEDIPIQETAAFGDQELDIPMIEAAGTAVAMGNAIEELKQKADYITKTNNEAGIAYAIEYFLNL